MARVSITEQVRAAPSGRSTDGQTADKLEKSCTRRRWHRFQKALGTRASCASLLGRTLTLNLDLSCANAGVPSLGRRLKRRRRRSCKIAAVSRVFNAVGACPRASALMFACLQTGRHNTDDAGSARLERANLC
eukprot:2650084-Pleurochrysis_carterae.AAC.1